MSAVPRVVIGHAERRSADSYEGRKADHGVKQSQRESVADWFIAHHEDHDPMRVLSFPDRYWTFENYLHRRRGVSFCGLQRDWKTLELSVPWMPESAMLELVVAGKRREYFEWVAKAGRLRGYKERDVGQGLPSMITYMCAADFFSLKGADVAFGPQGDYHSRCQVRDFSRNFRFNTAFWLDFNSPLCMEIWTSARRLSRASDPAHRSVPVVVSFLAARDRYRNDDERIDAMVDALTPGVGKWRREFVFGKAERHQSASSPYLSVFGTLELVPATLELKAGSTGDDPSSP